MFAVPSFDGCHTDTTRHSRTGSCRRGEVVDCSGWIYAVKLVDLRLLRCFAMGDATPCLLTRMTDQTAGY